MQSLKRILASDSSRIKVDNKIFSGYVVNYLSLSIMSSWDLSPYWILLASFSESLLGGRPTIFLTFLCYISDLSRLEDKAWNLALMDTAIYLSLPVGFFIGPYIFKHYGYPVVFGISAGGCLFAVLYLLIVMRETVEYTGHEVKTLENTYL